MLMLSGAAHPGVRESAVLLHEFLSILRCPTCGGTLRLGDENLHCERSSHVFPVVEGIPRLAVVGSAETWGVDEVDETSIDYQEQYAELVAAREYNEAYRDRTFKRWTTEREHRLLGRLLGSQGRCRTLLDLPCGGGRLSGVLEHHTELLIEADIGIGQVLYNKRVARPAVDRLWMTASGFHIPLADDSVDATVCCRLNHHLPTAEERERLVVELLRVSRRFVVMTFFDFHSVKNSLRRVRRPFDRKPPKMTMTVDGVAGHRYALIVKETV